MLGKKIASISLFLLVIIQSGVGLKAQDFNNWSIDQEHCAKLWANKYMDNLYSLLSTHQGRKEKFSWSETIILISQMLEISKGIDTNGCPHEILSASLRARSASLQLQKDYIFLLDNPGPNEDNREAKNTKSRLKRIGTPAFQTAHQLAGAIMNKYGAVGNWYTKYDLENFDYEIFKLIPDY